MFVTIAQINTKIGNITNNTYSVIKTIFNSPKTDVLIFPELVLLGYPAYDLIERDDIKIELKRSLQDICKASKLKPKLNIIIGTVRYDKSKKFNALYVIKNGHIIHTQDKQCLPNYDVFQDKRHFEPGTWSGVFEINGKKCALFVCEDLWANEFCPSINALYNVSPISQLDQENVDVIFCTSASPFEYGKHQKRYKLLESISKKFEADMVFVNGVGAHDDIIFDGQSMVFSEEGKCRFIADGFKEIVQTVDLNKMNAMLPLSKPSIEDIYHALVMGIKDYVSKSGSTRVVLGLSGGIDSAVTACLAVDALGAENVLGVTMPSQFSSKGSVLDSEELARINGLRCIEKSIEMVHNAYRGLFEGVVTSHNSGIVDENIQSRIRTNILMAISNDTGALILSTGNKTELAMGYSTLYGDMSGAISVLGDLWKTSVYALAHFINRNSIRIPNSTITKAPSAELRPNQKDQDTLPSYKILDEICDRYIVAQQSKSVIIKAGFDETLVEWIINRFHQNEYKRFQSPPILRVSKKAFGPSRLYKCITDR